MIKIRLLLPILLLALLTACNDDDNDTDQPTGTPVVKKRLVSVSSPETGGFTRYEYDEQKRLTAIRVFGGPSDQTGTLYTKFSYPTPNEVVVENVWGTIDKVRHTLNDKGQATRSETISSAFTRAGERRVIEINYSHDAAGHLTKTDYSWKTFRAERPEIAIPGRIVEEYTWEKDNLVRKTMTTGGDGVTTYEYFDTGRIVTITGLMPTSLNLPSYAFYWQNPETRPVKRQTGPGATEGDRVLSIKTDADGYVTEVVEEVGNVTKKQRTWVYTYE